MVHYPVAQSLTVVHSRSPSRSPSRQSSFANLGINTNNPDEGEGGGGGAYNEEAYTPGAGHSPVVRRDVRSMAAGDANSDEDEDIPLAMPSLASLLVRCGLLFAPLLLVFNSFRPSPAPFGAVRVGLLAARGSTTWCSLATHCATTAGTHAPHTTQRTTNNEPHHHDVCMYVGLD